MYNYSLKKFVKDMVKNKCQRNEKNLKKSLNAGRKKVVLLGAK